MAVKRPAGHLVVVCPYCKGEAFKIKDHIPPGREMWEGEKLPIGTYGVSAVECVSCYQQFGASFKVEKSQMESKA